MTRPQRAQKEPWPRSRDSAMGEILFFSLEDPQRDLPLSKWAHRFKKNVSMLCCSREPRRMMLRKRLEMFRTYGSIPWKRHSRRLRPLQHSETSFCFHQEPQASVCLKMNLIVANNLKKWSERS